ncbi:MAG: alpha/beta fold hydrolase [Polyangia bacterium]|nr:alpha/beta fold hydrolase [Polyangia bacterium]
MSVGTGYLFFPLGMTALLFACGDSGADPDPRIEALWDDPARCGAPSYKWLRDPSIGSLVSFEEDVLLEYDRTTLRSALSMAEVTFPSELQYDTRVYRFRYVTQDRGELTEATAVLVVPTIGPGGPRRLGLLAFLHGTSGFSDRCAPSTGLLYPVLAAALASVGYVVVAPDFIGMNGLGAASTQLHPYIVSEPTAIASLDAVRAGRVLLGDITGGDLEAERGVLLMGGSQGGHGALATARYAPYYAPEEEIIAVAASVPPSDLVNLGALNATSWMDGSSNYAAILASLADWYGLDLSEALAPPHDEQVPELMETMCRPNDLVPDATTVESLFTQPFRELSEAGYPLGLSPWSCALRENSIPFTSVEPLDHPPTLIVLGELDDLVDTPTERASFDRLCADGHRLEYLECQGANHNDTALGSLSEQLVFLSDRSAGEPWPEEKVCQRTAPVQCSGAAP